MTVSQPSTGTVDTGSQAVFLPGAVLPVTGPHRTSSRVPGLKALGTKSVLAHAHPPPLSCYSQVGSGAGGWPISSGLGTAGLQSALKGLYQRQGHWSTRLQGTELTPHTPGPKSFQT